MEVPKLDLEFLHPSAVSQNTYKQRSLPLKPGRKHYGNDKVFTYESYTSRVPSKKHEIVRQFDKRVTARDEVSIQTHRLIGVNEGGGRENNTKVNLNIIFIDILLTIATFCHTLRYQIVY